MIRCFHTEVGMRRTGRWSSVKPVIAILSAVCFLAMSLGSVTRAVAAEAFETWPKKPAEPAGAPIPPASVPPASVPPASVPPASVPPEGFPPAGDTGAAVAGDAAGQQASTGLSAGTIGWIALGAAAVIGIAVAAGSGGSGSTSNH